MSTTWDPPAAPAVLTGLADVDASLDKLTTAALWSLTEAEAVSAVELAHRAVCRAQGLLVAMIGEVAGRGLPADAGSATLPAWLRARLRMSPGEASAYAHTATRTTPGTGTGGGGLVATGEALSAGRIGLGHASVIGQAITRLGGDVPAAAKTAAETLLLGEAAIHDPVTLARIGDQVAAIVDPDGQDARDGDALRRQEARDAAATRFTMSGDGTGGAYLRGRLDAEGAETLRAALEPLAAPRSGSADGKDLRTAERRRADALVELARRALDTGELPAVNGERPHVVVTIPLATLMTLVGTATLPSGAKISAAHARAVACDCALIPAVLGGAGQVLDLGRTRRLFTGPVRKAITIRDRGCAFPGCDRLPAWCAK